MSESTYQIGDRVRVSESASIQRSFVGAKGVIIQTRGPVTDSRAKEDWGSTEDLSTAHGNVWIWLDQPIEGHRSWQVEPSTLELAPPSPDEIEAAIRSIKEAQ